jgi:hypothetical protein
MKMQTKNLNNEVKQRNALLRYLDQRTKKGGKPVEPMERAQIFDFDLYILRYATSLEFLREQYNAELKTFQAQQRQAAKDRAKAKRDQAKNPTPAQTSELTPNLATTYTSESLQDVGLHGWTRFRPDTPPDYSVYDQSTPGRPEWMRDEKKFYEETDYYDLPRDFRNISLTPEGNKVNTVFDRMNNPSASTLDSIDPFDVNWAGWDMGVWNSGETLFADQRENNDDFWFQRPLVLMNNFNTISAEVGLYGTVGYKRINALLRKEKEDSSGSIQQIVRIMDAGMRPAPATIFARRGVGENTFARMQKHLQVGDRFTDDVFTSASINPMSNWHSSPMVNIILTEGTPALWTSSRALRETENEVIIGRGVTYEVVSTDNERGWILRTVPPEGDYAPPTIPS